MEIILLGFILYQIIAIFGISIGLHRYYAHRMDFKISKFYEIIILLMVTIAGARSIIGWCAAHRIHHTYADTEKDPHSPDHKGFWNVVFNRWTIPKVERRLVNDLLKNKLVVFQHKYWYEILIIISIISTLISVKFFTIFVVIPFILSNIGYGLFNALGHKDNKPVTNMFIYLLSNGEAYHDKHHNDGGKIRLGKWDLSGLIIEKILK